MANQQYTSTPYGQNPYSNNSYTDPLIDNNNNNFDITEWLRLFLHYWYLFVIAVTIAFGAALLKNRKWLPQYYTQGTIIIKETSPYAGGQMALMQGFGVDAGYKNVNNQVIMLGSYDLICRTIDSIPFMKVEYITQGRFRTRNLYHNTPFTIETYYVHPEAYNETLFAIQLRTDGSIRVQSTNDDLPIDINTHYGDTIRCPLFHAIIRPNTNLNAEGKMYFRFRSKESLAQEFMSRLTLQFVGEGSTVLALGLASETPTRDQEFIDKLTQIYLLQNLEQKNKVADNSIQFINQQLQSLQTALVKSEGAMTNFRQENKFVDVNAYAAQLMTQIAAYDQQNMELRLRETYFDYLNNYLETNIQNEAVIAPTSLGLNEPMLMTLVQQLNDLRIQRGELSEKNVYYAKFTKDIDNVKTAIREVVNSMKASLEIEKNDLKKRFNEVEKQIQKLPNKELEMVAIERNYRIDDNYYTFFLQKRAEAEIQKAGNTPDNTILDKARIITMTNAKTKQKTTLIYIIIGLLIPFILIILSELTNNTIRTPKEIKRLTLFPLIGTIRHTNAQNPTLVIDKPRASYVEMLRTIRTKIEFILQRKNNITLLITSTEPADGKTLLATNLAALYASTGKTTLLIDLDLRKPNVHTKLGLNDGLGLSNYLIGDADLNDITLQHPNAHFDILRAGTVPPNPGELIHADKLAKLIQELKQKYNYIIIDTSPIGLVPDAYTLIEQTDLCLYIIRCMKTNKTFCQQTLLQIQEMQNNANNNPNNNTTQQTNTTHFGTNKVQLILSDTPTNSYRDYGYGYGYGNAYKYGYANKQQHKKGLQYQLLHALRNIIGNKNNKNTQYYFDQEE